MKRCVACVLLPTIFAACSTPEDPAPLSYEEFKAQAYHDPETGRYVINGDEPVYTESGLRDAYQAYLDSLSLSPHAGYSTVQQGLIVNLFNGNMDRWNFDAAANIAYCVSQSSFGSRYSAVVSAMATAAQAWAVSANVNFVHVTSADANCTNATPGLTFNVRQVSGAPFIASAFFPSFSRSQRELLVDATAFGNIAPFTLAGVFRHELGHTLGFRHEHTRPEAGACFENNQWAVLTAYDSKSVMHYPQCNGTNTGDLVLTSLDRYGARILYPRLLGNNLLWRNNDGSAAIWNFNAGPRYPGNPGPEWTVQGVGDLDNSGGTDIVWRHTNGQVQIWYMNDASIVGVAFPGGQDPSHIWAIQRTGDFNGDGRADILWRDTSGQLAIWFEGDINDAGFPGYNNVPAPVDLAWQVKGVGDFDGDGHADILWRHSGGQVAIWFMSGATRIGEAYPGGEDPFGVWSIHGVGDFNGDGQSDILWRDVNGQPAIWLIDHGGIAQYLAPGGPDPGHIWSIQGVGDFDGDGKSDIVWRDTSGLPALWIMDSGTIAEQLFPSTAGGGDWSIVGTGNF